MKEHSWKHSQFVTKTRRPRRQGPAVKILDKPNLTSNIIKTTLFRFVMKGKKKRRLFDSINLRHEREAVLPRAHMRNTPLDYKENFSESQAQSCLHKEPQQSTRPYKAGGTTDR